VGLHTGGAEGGKGGGGGYGGGGGSGDEKEGGLWMAHNKENG